MKSTYRESFGILYDQQDVTNSVQQIVNEVMAEAYPSDKARTMYAILSTICAAMVVLPAQSVTSFLVTKIGAKAAATKLGSFLIKAQGAGWLSKLGVRYTKSDAAWLSLGLAADLSVLEHYDTIKDGKFKIQSWMNRQSLLDLLEVCTIDETLLQANMGALEKIFKSQGELGFSGELDLFNHIIPAAWYADCVHLAAERQMSQNKAQLGLTTVAIQAGRIRAMLYRLIAKMYEEEVYGVTFNASSNELTTNLMVGGLTNYGIEAFNSILIYAQEAKKTLGDVGYETVCSLIAVSAHRAISKKVGRIKGMASYLMSRGVDAFLLGEEDE